MKNLFAGSRFITMNETVDEFRISSVYASPATGGCSGGEFFNCVIAGNFNGSDSELLDLCRFAEAQLDSPEKKMNNARILDADLLYFNDEIRDGNDFILPHPRMHLRKFVLVPLAEISDRIVAGHGKTPAELLDICTDETEIVKIAEHPADGGVWKEMGLDSRE